MRQPHPDIGDWWAVYDYGLDTVKGWALDYRHPYPEVCLGTLQCVTLAGFPGFGVFRLLGALLAGFWPMS